MTFRYGLIGGKVQEKTRYFSSTLYAERNYASRIRAKLATGYVEVSESIAASPAVPAARDERIEQRLSLCPDDDPAWAVYADWLHGCGDPRGELANTQLQLTEPSLKSARWKQLRLHEAKLLDRHRSLLPNLLQKQLIGQRARRLPHERDARYGPLAYEFEETRVEVQWNAGFIRRLRLASGGGHPFSVAELANETLAHPSTRFLRELTVGPEDYEHETYTDIPEMIASRSRPALRKLHMVDFPRNDRDVRWLMFDVSAVWKAAPNLEEVSLHGGFIDVGVLEVPKVRAFTLWTSGLLAETLDAVVGARWPSLEKLELLFGSRFQSTEATMQGLAPLLAETHLPKLTHLGLLNAEFADEIASALCDAPLSAQVEHLDLSLSMLSDTGAAVLAAGRNNFPKLESLDVSRSLLTDAGSALLGEAFGSLDSVNTAAQRVQPSDQRNRIVAIWDEPGVE